MGTHWGFREDLDDHNASDMPTPEEIRERAAEIRATWTPKVEYSRRMILNPLAFFGPIKPLAFRRKRLDRDG